jgi:hypothetical protein
MPLAPRTDQLFDPLNAVLVDRENDVVIFAI